MLLRAGQSPLEPRLVTVSDGVAVQMRATPGKQEWAAAMESVPPDTWTESGQTPVLPQEIQVAASACEWRPLV